MSNWADPFDPRLVFGMFKRDDPALIEQLRILTGENERLRAEMDKKEEAAYLHGLGDRAKVYHDNLVLTKIIAGLIDRRDPSGL